MIKHTSFNAVCGLGKSPLWATFETFAFEEQIFTVALGAEIFVEASLTFWSFAFHAAIDVFPSKAKVSSGTGVNTGAVVTHALSVKKQE